MKIKHLVIVSLILAIITIGAASATDDSDALAIEDSDELAVDDVDVVAASEDEGGDEPGDTPGEEPNEEPTDEISADDFSVSYEKSIVNNSEDNVIVVGNYYESVAGNLTVTVGDSETPIYNNVFKKDNYFNLTDLGINSPGDYKILVNFIPVSGTGITLLDYTLKVTENEDHSKINAYIPSYTNVNPIEDDTGYIVEYYNEYGLEGKIQIYVDNELCYDKAIMSDDEIYFDELNKKIQTGERFVQVKYFDGENTTLLASKIVTINYNLYIDEYYDDDEPVVYFGSDESLTIKLPKDATGDLYLILNGKETKLNYKEGVAKYTIPSNDLKLGEDYSLTVELRNDELYPLKNKTYYIETKFSVDCPDEMSVGENEFISINLPSSYSGVLKVYTSDENLVGSANVVNGKASISLAKLTEGYHDLTVEYNNGVETFTSSDYVYVMKNNAAVSVTVQPATIEVGNSVTVKITGPKTLNQNFEIYVDGNMVPDKINLLNVGEMTYSVKFDTVGNHLIKVYTNNEDYYGEGDEPVFYSNTFTVTVKEKSAVVQPAKTPAKITLTLKKVKVKKSAKKLVIQATLKVNGKAPKKGTKVTFKFNGKKYTAKTNAKGVAKVTIKKKVLKKLKVGKKIKYQVTYGKTTKKLTVKVKK